MHTKLTLKNIYIHYMMMWLQAPLHGEQARFRNKFLTAIRSVFDDLTEKRKVIIESNAKRGEDGKPIIKDGSYELPEERKVQNEKDVNALYDQEVIITVDKQVIKGIRTVFQGLTRAMGIEEGRAYDELMEKLEAIK